MPAGIVINGVKGVFTIAAQILDSATEEVVWISPASVHSLSIARGFLEKTRAYCQRGGASRGIVPISHSNLEEIQTFLDVGEDIRHSEDVHELFMIVGDKQQSISAINVGIRDFTLDTPAISFWSEDPTYAEYLLASFENSWSQAVPAEGRIQELLQKE
ncbi:MAG: hypothetical protein ACXVI8_07385 [Halobacteriota archaeon]